MNVAQISAFCMAVLWRGLDLAERVALTNAMAHSGSMLRWSVNGPVIDKHSTGGVGDKTSLILAPLLASCGVYVPMIAGRGLGHTGGTWDKLESIPGYRVQPSKERFQEIVSTLGCAIIGQSSELAPADRRMYAVRDVTATVESLDLITASILSKKIAAGLEGLVMDVKFGSGAFIKDPLESQALADSLEAVGRGAGLRMTCRLTDMNQVLGDTAGNALEVFECVEWLRTGKAKNKRLESITLDLASDMLLLSGLYTQRGEALKKCRSQLENGQAAEKFSQMVAAQGGPTDFLENAETYLPAAPITQPLFAKKRDKTVHKMNVYEIGMAIVALGGGRTSQGQKIDHAVGLSDVCDIGASTDAPLAMIHARSKKDAAAAAERLLGAIEVA